VNLEAVIEGMQPQAKEHLESPELEDAWKDSPIEPLEGVWHTNIDTLMPGFWPTEL
jgi:hypothetical protein